MTNWTKNTWMAAAVAAIALTVPASAQNQNLASIERVHAQAAEANTAAKHAEVARQYRLHAEALESQAKQYEKEAASLTRSAGAIVHKFPGMATGQLQKTKTKAVETRRAARETMALADRHIRLAVEAQAGAPVAGN